VNAAGLETANSFRNSAAYVQNWLKVLKDDKRFIVSAAGKAEKAVRFFFAFPLHTEKCSNIYKN
jgi:antirestriction protein ArdC